MAVYTCTLNLAIDLFIETDEMKPFQVNRTKDDDIQANGKGVNVSDRFYSRSGIYANQRFYACKSR